jgi:hypothetical protein
MADRASRFVCFLICLTLTPAAVHAQTKAPAPATAGSSAKPARKADPGSAIEPGAVTNGVYRNKTLALSCKIPPGWVLRTDELNAQSQQKEEEKQDEKKEGGTSPQPAAAPSTGAKVLLATFSRPPEARAEDVNSSILIAAESVAAYPGLTDAAQYFFPLTEVAKAQGFSPDEDPYGSAVGTKALVRGDFHKNVGTRVMRQSTLAMLAHGYVISITVIAGTDDEVEDLIDTLDFVGNKAASGK